MADQYALYDFKHNDKREFLSEFDWYKSRYINEPFDFAFNNKVICSEILRQYIRVAENHFIKNKGIIYDFSGNLYKGADICENLKTYKRLIVKPFAMGKGNGVHLISYENQHFYFDEKPADKSQIAGYLDKNEEYVICEYIEQHKYGKELFDKTANTIRLITMRDIESHKVKLFFAVQRIGTNHTVPVDNGSKGGLISKINLDTGELSEAKCLHNLEIYDSHPDTGSRIKGTKIPNWEAIKEEILSVAEKLPFMDFIAWDVLVTEEGICVIEANSSSGVNIIQIWGGQKNKELGKFFKHYKVIK